MTRFERLVAGQIILLIIAGALAGVSFSEHGFSAAAVSDLALCTLLAVIGWLGPQIVHELAEVNDQLAGRSKELHRFLQSPKDAPREH